MEDAKVGGGILVLRFKTNIVKEEQEGQIPVLLNDDND